MSAATPFATNFSMLARAARPGVGRAADAPLLVPAQGIQCGALSLAFPYAWARAIIEDFSLTPVPNAPAWLVGAANVEGEIVPVFDLASWVAGEPPERSPGDAGPRRARLLVGGHEGDRAAIFVSGPARMVRYAPEAQLAVDEMPLPERLRAVVVCASETTPQHWVVDARRLFDVLAQQLTS